MLRLKCPICEKKLEIATIDDLPSFPFCSGRCKLIDLGRWIDGAYQIPAEAPRPGDADERPAVESEEE